MMTHEIHEFSKCQFLFIVLSCLIEAATGYRRFYTWSFTTFAKPCELQIMQGRGSSLVNRTTNSHCYRIDWLLKLNVKILPRVPSSNSWGTSSFVEVIVFQIWSTVIFKSSEMKSFYNTVYFKENHQVHTTFPAFYFKRSKVYIQRLR